MIRKGPPKNSNKLDQINQANHTEVPHQAVTFSPPLKNRVSLAAVITRQPSKKNAISLLGEQQQSIKQKENLIKQLQQQITFKKQQNDAVQQAFRMRQQYTVFFNKTENPQKRMKCIAVGASLLASHSKTFKRALLKQLRLVFREWKTNRTKAAKLLLLWLVGWINNLFNMLGRSLPI